MNTTNKNSLSVFFVVKNEAETIHRALDSVVEIADQIVIGIDSASSDGTENLVRQFALDHQESAIDIYNFQWDNNFAKARNLAIEKCIGEWILQLDGHEYLHQHSNSILKQYLQKMPENVWLLSVRMDLEPLWHLGTRQGEEIPEIWFMQPHIWRNKKGIKYQGASHNQIPLDICPMENRLRTPDITIVHDRPKANAKERRQQRKTMNIPYFDAELAENPEDHRALYYQAMGHVDASVQLTEDDEITYDQERLSLAIPYAKKYLQIHGSNRPEEAYEMASKLGEIYYQSSEFELAKHYFLQCIKYSPLRAESYYHLGEVAIKNMELLDSNNASDRNKESYYRRLFIAAEEAIHWLKCAARIKPPVTSYFLKAPVYTFLPALKLAELNENLYRYTGKDDYFLSAIAWYDKVLKQLPNNEEIMAARKKLSSDFLNDKSSKKQKSQKWKIAIINKTGQFTGDLARKLNGDSFDVKTWQQPLLHAITESDLIFCSWADDFAAMVSHMEIDRPLVVRLCRYEAYTKILDKINWKNVNKLVFPNHDLKQYVLDNNSIESDSLVISHGIDLDRFSFSNRSHGKNIAIAGYIHSRKNFSRLAEIISLLPEHHFHIAGEIQQLDCWADFQWRISSHSAQERVTFHGWQKDINSWMDKVDANYLLSTSWNESFGYIIAEAMAKGIMPIIYDFQGARQLWPENQLFTTDQQLLQIISQEYHSESYRNWIETHFSVEDEAQQYKNLFTSLLK